jgi:hypothetical protein
LPTSVKHNSKSPNFEIAGVLAIMPSRDLFYTKVDFIFQKQRRHKPPIKVRLVNNGRLKPKEVYYFDHPLFGLFVLIKPVVDDKFID